MTPEPAPQETSPFATPLKTLVQLFNESSDSHVDPDDKEGLSADEVLDLLAAARRRAAIEHLATTNQAHVRVTDLAERVAGTEYDRDPADVSSDERKRVYISMIQSHLPPLDDAGVVDYDKEAKIVTPGPQFETIWRVHAAVQKELS